MAGRSSGGGGIGFFGLLAVLFIGLKLGHVIDWSWWWVTAPLWGSILLKLLVIAVCAIVYVAICLLEGDGPRGSLATFGRRVADHVLKD